MKKTDIIIPNNCPECDSKLNRFSVDLVCENMGCPAKTKGIFSNLFNTLDIKGLSDAFIEKVTEKYEITTIAQLMQLTVTDFEQLDGFAKRSAQKAYDAVHSVKEVSPEQFFALLNIPNQGVRVFENLFSQFPMEALLDENFKPSDVLNIKGIAEKSAIAIHEGVQANLDRLRENAEWFTIKKKQVEVIDTTSHSSKMVGKSFCITGALVHGKRKDYENKIKDAGGKTGSVTKTLDYLVTNDTDTSSSKMKKTLDLNDKNHNAGIDKRILIITEDDLIEMMEK